MTDAPPEITALRALDAEAISAVHARYFVELYRYAAYRTGDPQLAEDLASEVLVRLLEAMRAGKLRSIQRRRSRVTPAWGIRCTSTPA